METHYRLIRQFIGFVQDSHGGIRTMYRTYREPATRSGSKMDYTDICSIYSEGYGVQGR